MLTLNHCGKKLAVMPVQWPDNFVQEKLYAELGCEQALYFSLGKGAVKELGEGIVHTPSTTTLGTDDSGIKLSKAEITIAPNEEVQLLKRVNSRFVGWYTRVMTTATFRSVTVSLEQDLIQKVKLGYEQVLAAYRKKYDKIEGEIVRSLPKLNFGQCLGKDKEIRAMWFSLVCGVRRK
jgi:hypothetical protein